MTIVKNEAVCQRENTEDAAKDHVTKRLAATVPVPFISMKRKPS